MNEYNIIYADPPWSYKDNMPPSTQFGVNKQYETQSVSYIKSLDIQSITAKDATLWLWTTSPMLREGLEVIEAWGFKYKTVAFCWVKKTSTGKTCRNLGRWTMGSVELCLLATKGHPKRVNKNIYQLIEAERIRHSAKPSEARDRIVNCMGDLPRIELFAREKTEKWDVWGNEVQSDIILSPKAA